MFKSLFDDRASPQRGDNFRIAIVPTRVPPGERYSATKIAALQQCNIYQRKTDLRSWLEAVPYLHRLGSLGETHNGATQSSCGS
jgi:hypothetical protein